MGCAFSVDNTPRASSPMVQHITVVIAAEGKVKEVEVPSLEASMKVGELLLEFQPGHFLARFDCSCFDASATAISVTHERASPLGADTDAIPSVAHVYVLFPMPRLHTRLTPKERQTFALLLHNHRSQLRDKLPGSAPALRSRAKRRGARVAPLISSKDTQHQDDSDSVDNEQGTLKEELQGQYTVPTISEQQVQQMMKAKPWAPRLETINEGQDELCS